ncbi:transposase [Emergencia sp. JLR.KK010]
MNRTSLELKNLIMDIINKQKQDLTDLVSNPKTDFSRNRKIPYEKMILSLLTMEGASLSNELLRQFGYGLNTATSSAFVQQRKNILPKAFASLFHDFTAATYSNDNYKGYKLLAVDGSDIQIATNLNDKDALFQIAEGVKPYNLLHLNALYNLKSHTYEDAVVFKRKEAGENKALTEMVDRSALQGNVIVIADRGYEAYNNMAHIQEKGWFYLIRVKDFNQYSSGILHGLELPDTDEFPADTLKQLYGMRRGIETSFRDLKYTVFF